MQKECEAIDFTPSQKNFHFISNMLVGKIFYFDLKFVGFLKSVFCVWNRGVKGFLQTFWHPHQPLDKTRASKLMYINA